MPKPKQLNLFDLSESSIVKSLDEFALSSHPFRWRHNLANLTPEALNRIYHNCSALGKIHLLLFDLINRCRITDDLLCRSIWHTFRPLFDVPSAFYGWYTKGFYAKFEFNPKLGIVNLAKSLAKYVLTTYDVLLHDFKIAKALLRSIFVHAFMRASYYQTQKTKMKHIIQLIVSRQKFGHRYTLAELEKEILAACETESSFSDSSNSSESSDESSESSNQRDKSPVRITIK